jgi:hypothetical protein
MTDPTPFNVKKPASVVGVKKPASVTKATGAAKGASDNLPDERVIGMTFNMPQSWHNQFKIRAVTEGKSMRQLLLDCFDAYKRENDK